MPSRYDPADFPPFAVTVDLVVLTVRDGRLQVLLVRRGVPPYRGRWALPGGFVGSNEDLGSAAARELQEETSLSMNSVHLEQLATYGDPRRDPRTRVVSVAHLVLAPDLPAPTSASDARDAQWVEIAAALTSRALAFDHTLILTDGVERARAKLEYSTLAATFCEDDFTVAELRHVYEAVWATELDPRNFHRKVTGAEGFLVPTGVSSARNGGRPAQLFRKGSAIALNPPILRVAP